MAKMNFLETWFSIGITVLCGLLFYGLYEIGQTNREKHREEAERLKKYPIIITYGGFLPATMQCDSVFWIDEKLHTYSDSILTILPEHRVKSIKYK